ncbi:mechanosensitive ion channel family protein [Candidatus Gracilibacteria bacterium]|nr:mechanosensitive ion channel family protein [Candidatus Gracilibacteria bacterium]
MFLAYLVAKAGEGDSAEVSGLAQKIAGFFDYIIAQVPSWIAGGIVFIASFLMAKLAKAAVESRIGDKIDEEHQEVLVLAGRVTYFVTLILGVTIALKIAGIDLTTILAAVAFGIGFALQDLIMNFLSGVLILVSRQFTIGDFIKVGSTTGKVMEIQTRATILKATDGTKVIVPNSEIFRNQVVSYTTNPTRRVIIPIYVSYDTDISYAVKIALDVLKNHPKIYKKPAPSVVINGYGDSCIEMTGRFWVGSRDGWFKIKSELNQQMLEALTEAGIEIPYNILHLETSSDTKMDNESNASLRKKRMEEMRLSKAIAASAPSAPPLEAQLPANPTVIAIGAATPPPTPVPAPVMVESVDPVGSYQDQLEIDGQA